MPRAMTIQRTTIPPYERARYMEVIRSRMEYYDAAQCRFSVFEDVGLPNAFVEFTEADDAATLSAAHANAPVYLDALRTYEQVELTRDAISNDHR